MPFQIFVAVLKGFENDEKWKNVTIFKRKFVQLSFTLHFVGL